jgi:predicted Rossmann fold nucleotide-binding protein DprA/Smf involved in DNA uptake
MTTEQITENAKAILLLCGRFGAGDDTGAQPLNIKEYDEVASWLASKKWWPADLLNEEKQGALSDAFAPVDPARIKALLARGASMAIAVEKWINKGLWVLCRSDEAYPQRLKQHLKRCAPPILYGAGDRALLSKGGLAVVGSRHIDVEAEEFACSVGRGAAQSGMQLISGAARGVDETAMHGAFEEGGSVIGVMADSLLRASVSGKYREGIRNGQLMLISTYNPEAGFNVGNAMGRNKYIYALADFAVVVSSDYQEGGTWAGAEEELRRDGGRPVFVRTGAGVPRGNTELLHKGAKPFPTDALASGLKDALNAAIATRAEHPSLPLKDEVIAADEPPVIERTPATYPESTVEMGATKMAVHETPTVLPPSVYEAVKPLILKALDKSRTLDDLVKTLKVRKTQLQDWVKLLLKEGVIEERTIRKSKKLAIRKPDEELKLS